MEKQLGALPVVREFLARLDLVGVVDRLCPVRDLSRISNGQAVAVLVAKPADLPDAAAARRGLGAGLGGRGSLRDPADALNDDRLGRALDALAEQAEAVVGSVGARAVAEFGLDASRIHWDLTSISMFGAYPEVADGCAAPKYGHSKDRRPDLKQVQAGLAVTGDGGNPLLARAYDGGAAEVSQVVSAMRALREVAGERRFLLVGDTELVSWANLTDLVAAGVGFVAPAAKSVVPQKVLAALDRTTATPADYTALRDEGKFAHQRGSYRATEGTTTLKGPRKTDPPLTVRTVFLWSSTRAQAAATARAGKLDRARDDLARLPRGLGSHHYPDEKSVTARLAAIGKNRRVAAYLHAPPPICLRVSGSAPLPRR